MIKSRKLRKTNLRIKLFYLFIFFVLTISCVFLITCRKNGTDSNILTEVDETDKWIRHTVDKNVNRDHGHSINVGDLNQDGIIDILIAQGERRNFKCSDGIYWYEATVYHKQKKWQRYRLSDPKLPIRWSMATAVGDMDNDDDLDIIALSFNNSNVYLCINPLIQGKDIYAPWETIIVLESPGIHRDGERVELVDFDKDGFLDILFPRGKPHEVHIIFNPGGKIYQKWNDTIIGSHGGSDAHDVFPSDIDCDGDIDVFVASGDKEKFGDIFWFENPNTFPIKKPWNRYKISQYSSNYGALQVNDINMDGKPDIFATQAHGTPGKVMWFKNHENPQKKWLGFTIDTHNFPHAGLAFDADGDFQAEYWVADASHDLSGRYGRRSGGIVYYKVKNIGLNQWTKHRVAHPPEVGRQCRAIDVDNDGDLDVISTADHDMKKHLISVVWWENKLNDE